MRLQEIRYGLVVLRLDPLHCQKLAQVCQLAAAHMPAPEQEALRQYVEVAGAAFAASAAAGLGQWHARQGDLAALYEELDAMGL